MYTHRKVAQIAAVFASKSGGAINLLKLMKLMYLADRESIARHGLPISFDRYVSMGQGPVLSRTLDLINGNIDGFGGAQWQEWIGDRENFLVTKVRLFERSDLDQLSDADLEILDEIWKKFGKLDQWTLRDYTHKHCSEWKDPDHSSIPIEDKEIFIALGYDESEAVELADEIEGERAIDRAIDLLRAQV